MIKFWISIIKLDKNFNLWIQLSCCLGFTHLTQLPRLNFESRSNGPPSKFRQPSIKYKVKNWYVQSWFDSLNHRLQKLHENNKVRLFPIIRQVNGSKFRPQLQLWPQYNNLEVFATTLQPQVRLHRSHLPTFYYNIKVCSVTVAVILNHG